MLFVLCRSLKRNEGSAVAAFALVAPVVVFVFIVVIQIGSVLADRTTLTLAAQSGVRIASTLDGTNSQGRVKALSVLRSRGMSLGSVITFQDERRGAMHYVACTATSRRHISWLNRDVTYSVKARAIDESLL